ncbi:response regulator [Neolewinella antarctica]|uniref:CheY-like chemotaxis protein n=1 Tax=Neolewinella antarctica TaxID=442734 RepID=A0ABX0XG18_9BACT|nr:response regulator [Neolewinella antarctica]NJC27823.1 CheY-like chemotaxis protein [Neolewinella antarctica]
MIDRILKVFLLEDRPVDAELTKRALLKFAPNSVITVANGEQEFLQRIQWAEYDIMLADYHLPGYNGLEALLHVREHFPGMPFVFVTGQINNEQKATEAVLHGANGYVLKENLDQLEGAIKKALKNARDRQQREDLLAEKKQTRSLMLQKAVYLLNSSDDFPKKGEIQEALNQVQALG